MTLNNPGVYSPEDMVNGEDQVKSGGSTNGISDTSHASCGRHSSSELSMQSIVELNVPSVKEGVDLLNCKSNVSETQKKDVIGGNSGVVEEVESIKTYQKRKRLKITQPSDQPTNNPDIANEKYGTSLHCVAYRVDTTFDQSVDIEPMTPQSISGAVVTAEDSISVEVVDANKLLEKDVGCILGLHDTVPNNDDKAVMETSNENGRQNCDAIVSNEVLTEMENKETPTLDSGDACCTAVPLHLNAKKICFPASSDGTTINRYFCDADILTNNLQEEVQVETTKNVCNVDLPELAESICKPEEESVTSDTDISLKDVSSQVVNKCTSAAVESDFARYTKKKLLVLDVNGLLVDICSFVPYNCDPDDIIMRKAVFKRPYCDDFLKFCFERFAVGVWTSRTKWNIEPIIDFLLGNDKSKLLFCWDQSHCTNTGFYSIEKRNKPLLLKKLKKLWDKCDPDLPWERGVYNETNTLLLDDTPSKALLNPRYNAVFPSSYQFRNMNDDNSLGPGGDLRTYLEELAMADDVQEYVKRNPFGQRAIIETNLSWSYYLKVIEAGSTPPRETEEDNS